MDRCILLCLDCIIKGCVFRLELLRKKHFDWSAGLDKSFRCMFVSDPCIYLKGDFMTF